MTRRRAIGLIIAILVLLAIVPEAIVLIKEAGPKSSVEGDQPNELARVWARRALDETAKGAKESKRAYDEYMKAVKDGTLDMRQNPLDRTAGMDCAGFLAMDAAVMADDLKGLEGLWRSFSWEDRLNVVSTASVYCSYARIYRKRNDLANYRKYMSMAMQLPGVTGLIDGTANPPNPSDGTDLARVLIFYHLVLAGDTPQARSMLKPGCDDSYVGFLVKHLARAGKIDEARAVVALTTNEEERSKALGCIAVAQAKVGDFEDAEKTAAGLRRAEIRSSAYALIAAVHAEKKDESGFDRCMQLAIAAEPCDWHSAAVAYATAGKVREAEAALGKTHDSRSRGMVAVLLAKVDSAASQRVLDVAKKEVTSGGASMLTMMPYIEVPAAMAAMGRLDEIDAWLKTIDYPGTRATMCAGAVMGLTGEEGAFYQRYWLLE